MNDRLAPETRDVAFEKKSCWLPDDGTRVHIRDTHMFRPLDYGEMCEFEH